MKSINSLMYKIIKNGITKNKISHLYPIKERFMNTNNGNTKFQNSRIILDSGRCSKIITEKMTSKL